MSVEMGNDGGREQSRGKCQKSDLLGEIAVAALQVFLNNKPSHYEYYIHEKSAELIYPTGWPLRETVLNEDAPLNLAPVAQ